MFYNTTSFIACLKRAGILLRGDGEWFTINNLFQPAIPGYPSGHMTRRSCKRNSRYIPHQLGEKMEYSPPTVVWSDKGRQIRDLVLWIFTVTHVPWKCCVQKSILDSAVSWTGPMPANANLIDVVLAAMWGAEDTDCGYVSYLST